jgi:hypothetical protein
MIKLKEVIKMNIFTFDPEDIELMKIEEILINKKEETNEKF